MTSTERTALLSRMYADFAACVKRETGADVELTLIGTERISIFTEDGARFPQVVKFVKQIPSLTYETEEHYPEDSMYCAFFALNR